VSLLRGLRGFAREFSRTGSLRAFWLQTRTGAAHVARQIVGRHDPDPIRAFLANYGPDGLGLHDPELAAVQLDAQRCIACGLCNLACAQAGGAPELEPHEAVACASRLAIDVTRLGAALPAPAAEPCVGCGACETVCPTRVPVARIQAVLARLRRDARGKPAPLMAWAGGMR
jgi:ferredoxin